MGYSECSARRYNWQQSPVYPEASEGKTSTRGKIKTKTKRNNNDFFFFFFLSSARHTSTHYVTTFMLLCTSRSASRQQPRQINRQTDAWFPNPIHTNQFKGRRKLYVHLMTTPHTLSLSLQFFPRTYTAFLPNSHHPFHLSSEVTQRLTQKCITFLFLSLFHLIFVCFIVHLSIRLSFYSNFFFSFFLIYCSYRYF